MDSCADTSPFFFRSLLLPRSVETGIFSNPGHFTLLRFSGLLRFRVPPLPASDSIRPRPFAESHNHIPRHLYRRKFFDSFFSLGVAFH